MTNSSRLVNANIPGFSNLKINQVAEDQDSKIAKLNRALRVPGFSEAELIQIRTAMRAAGVELTAHDDNQWQEKQRAEAN